MAYNPNAQATQAYPVQQGQQYGAQPISQPYGGQPVQQPYGQVANATVVAQPYNGPTAQEAVVSQAGNQQPIIIVRQGNGGQAAQVPPPDYCCIAWLSCLFCCPAIGLVAICLSSSVNPKWRRGDFEGANNASEMARKVSIAAVLIGLIWQISVTVYESNGVESSTDSNDSRMN